MVSATIGNQRAPASLSKNVFVVFVCLFYLYPPVMRKRRLCS